MRQLKVPIKNALRFRTLGRNINLALQIAHNIAQVKAKLIKFLVFTGHQAKKSLIFALPTRSLQIFQLFDQEGVDQAFFHSLDQRWEVQFSAVQ
jgi:hypothetical protein